MAAGERTTVRADRLDDLVAALRSDGVEIGSADRETVTIKGLDSVQIGEIARDQGIALHSLVPEQRSLEDVFMSLTADAVQYHGTSQIAA